MASGDQRSGVVRDSEGKLVIPGSRRPDGTWRKPVRVKEGYVPQDERPVYENQRAKTLKDRPDIPGLVMDTPKPSLAKKKEKKQSQKEPNVGGVSKALATTSISKSVSEDTQDTHDPVKRLRNLKKKLAQIYALKSKIDSGELKNPDPDQLRKLERSQEYAKEIADLEASMQ